MEEGQYRALMEQNALSRENIRNSDPLDVYRQHSCLKSGVGLAQLAGAAQQQFVPAGTAVIGNNDSAKFKEKTIRQELQAEIDEWLADVKK